MGLYILARAVGDLLATPPPLDWVYLAGLTLLASSFTVKLPALPVNLSASETFVFSTVLLFGIPAGVVTVVLDALVISLRARGTRSSIGRFLFNATAPLVAMAVAGNTALQATSATGLHGTPPGFGQAALLASLYFASNAALVAVAMALDRGAAALRMWRRNLPALSVNYFVGYCISLFVVTYFKQINLAAIVIAAPVLLVSYVTFRTSLGRVEDANRHLTQMSELYLSTIEALAMAVDAKDQITHGHIRRVQVFATQLAEKLGVGNTAQVRAIETAALLHDMGKLAIPEFILNKPGKLTGPEFEKMKRHAEIGADLLSSISFPYPVVPIVRHHHENWDGSGYPTGLSAHDIPLGARILSVVDCFDALTSDRPYRPRMSNDDSFQILRERSGSMYDPLVVDTFIQVFDEIAPAAIRAGQEAKSLVPSLSSDKWHALQEIRLNAAQSTILGEFEQAISRSATPLQALDTTGSFLGLLTPGEIVALYSLSAAQNLVCVAAYGEGAAVLKGLKIPHGERTTGWAVAHESVMANSPAALDLIDLATTFSPPLMSALTSPIRRDGRVVGALTVYAVSATPFNDDHRYVIGRVADLFAQNVDPADLLRRSGTPLLGPERRIPPSRN